MRGLALALVVAGCAPSDGGGAADRLAAAMTAADTVDLGALAPFDWDRVVIVEPYTDERSFEARSGVEWPMHWRWSDVEVLDGRQLLVFVGDGRAVAAFEYLFAGASFAPAVLPPDRYRPLAPRGFARDEARFVSRRDGEGWRVWVPASRRRTRAGDGA